MPATTNYRSRAYQHIRNKLMLGELRDGQRLSEISLATEIGISRTPVREALGQLVSEGLLERDGAGITVRRISEGDLRELLNLRSILEVYAVGRAARRITGDEVRDLRRIFDQLRQISREIKKVGMDSWTGPLGKRLAMTDMLFHMLILQAARSPRTQKIVLDFRLLTLRYLPQSLMNLNNLSISLLEHWKIYRALRAHDGLTAKRYMREHQKLIKHKALTGFEMAQPSGELSLTVNDWSKALKGVMTAAHWAPTD